MAAFWLERRRREEQAERDFQRSKRERRLPLLPLEKTPPADPSDSAGSTLPVEFPLSGGVSSSGATVEEASVATTDGRPGVSSTVDEDRAA